MPRGLCLSRVQKFGDVHVVMGEEAQEEAFARLFNIRRMVQRQRSLDWKGLWPMNAQKDCQRMLRERWQASDELPRDRFGRSNRKQRDSWYHMWCYQQSGGEGWTKVFFAFGRVDAHTCGDLQQRVGEHAAQRGPRAH